MHLECLKFNIMEKKQMFLKCLFVVECVCFSFNSALYALYANLLKLWFSSAGRSLTKRVGHSNLSCGSLMCLLSAGYLFKTCKIISVDFRKALVTI